MCLTETPAFHLADSWAALWKLPVSATAGPQLLDHPTTQATSAFVDEIPSSDSVETPDVMISAFLVAS